MKVLALVNRPATFIVPPSTVKAAPTPAPITLVPTVPMLRIPLVSLNKPLLFGKPFCPTTVALGLFSQKPAAAGIVYDAVGKTGLDIAKEPCSSKVPFVSVRKPGSASLNTGG